MIKKSAILYDKKKLKCNKNTCIYVFLVVIFQESRGWLQVESRDKNFAPYSPDNKGPTPTSIWRSCCTFSRSPSRNKAWRQNTSQGFVLKSGQKSVYPDWQPWKLVWYQYLCTSKAGQIDKVMVLSHQQVTRKSQ